MGGGASRSLTSQDYRAAMHIAVLDMLPAGVYALEERRFEMGSFFETPEFAEQKQHCPVFVSLGLHEWAVSHIWRHFQKMNETGSGEATLWEFREYFDLPDDRSTTRLFRCFDEDRNNRISFLEFVVGLWTYCCNCNASVVCLCFDLYDADHNGQIGTEEFEFMIQDIFGPEWKSNDVARTAHTWFHERDDAVLGFPELGMDAWSEFLSVNLQIQAPALHTRLILQKKVLGVGFWTYCLRKSLTIFLGHAVKVEKILSAHVSLGVLEELAHDRRLDLDHDESTQLTLRVLRRTGPFPRRRKYRELAGKKLRIKEGAVAAPTKVAKFTTVTVREAFERVTVPAGQDATWEETKPPSALQALMTSLKAITDRAPSGGKSSSPAGTPPSRRHQETGPSATMTRTTLSSSPTVAKKGRPPDALSLLNSRPGLDGAPLGSPTTALARAGSGGVCSVESDPTIANAFHGLKPLPSESGLEGPVHHKPVGSNKGRAKTASAASRSARRVATRTVKKGSSSAPSTAGAVRTVGGGKSMLSRTGKELV
ncbi:unnamed protein product, partial [Scytosiphon promiscuus]